MEDARRFISHDDGCSDKPVARPSRSLQVRFGISARTVGGVGALN